MTKNMASMDTEKWRLRVARKMGEGELQGDIVDAAITLGEHDA